MAFRLQRKILLSPSFPAADPLLSLLTDWMGFPLPVDVAPPGSRILEDAADTR